MASMTHDTARTARSGRTLSGLAFALVSAASFGLSGALARPLLDNGWTPGAVVIARVGLAALVVAPFGIRALHGRWYVLRANARTLLVYGSVAVASTQFFYFSAVAHMEVAPALLIEFTAPGVQPLSSSGRASAPDSPNDAAEISAKASPARVRPDRAVDTVS